MAEQDSLFLRAILVPVFTPMRSLHDRDPILPTNMATNGKGKSERRRVLVVGAGAAGLFSLVGSDKTEILPTRRDVMRVPSFQPS